MHGHAIVSALVLESCQHRGVYCFDAVPKHRCLLNRFKCHRDDHNNDKDHSRNDGNTGKNKQSPSAILCVKSSSSLHSDLSKQIITPC